MHCLEVREIEEGVAAEGLQAAARVARPVAEEPAADRIGDLRGVALRPGVLPTKPLSGDKSDIR